MSDTPILPPDPEADTEDNTVATEVRGHVRGSAAATLCTNAAQRGIEGFPFGSVVPYALGADGLPVVLLATIASHTANLHRDPRATLFVREPDLEGDPQAGWRVSVVARWQRMVPVGRARKPVDVEIDADALADVAARYAEKVPGSVGYQATHDFHFWRPAEVVRIRYIGGFGRIHWLAGTTIGPTVSLGDTSGAVDHMNDDHRESMIEMCSGLYGFTPRDAHMLSLDATGFHVATDEPARRVFFSFGREIAPGDVRLAVIDVLKRARSKAQATA